jgi:hypothetical protein
MSKILSKLMKRVRFPSPAPPQNQLLASISSHSSASQNAAGVTPGVTKTAFRGAPTVKGKEMSLRSSLERRASFC